MREPETAEGRDADPCQRRKQRWLPRCRLPGSVRRQQLEGEIAVLDAELKWRFASSSSSPALTKAQELLESARREAADHRIAPGYQALNCARRLAVDAYCPQEVRAAAVSLRAEARDEKLSKWRRSSICRLLAPLGESDDAPARELLGAAGDDKTVQRLAGVLNGDDADDALAARIGAVLLEEGYQGGAERALAQAVTAEGGEPVGERQVRSALVDLACCDESAYKARLREAMWIRDEGLANHYRKTGLGAILVLAFSAGFSESLVVRAVGAATGNKRSPA